MTLSTLEDRHDMQLPQQLLTAETVVSRKQLDYPVPPSPLRYATELWNGLETLMSLQLHIAKESNM